MKKFKLGDRVRVLEDIHGVMYKEGFVGYITMVNLGDYCINDTRKYEHGANYYMDNELELVEEPLEVVEPEDSLEDESGVSSIFRENLLSPIYRDDEKVPTYNSLEDESGFSSLFEELLGNTTCYTEDSKPDGGPSKYYDMPYHSWVTTNDQMEYLAEHKWKLHAIHLKDIFKGLCRWGDKKGTSVEYDTKKIIYYGCRVLRMIVGTNSMRDYLQKLLDDPQFEGD